MSGTRNGKAGMRLWFLPAERQELTTNNWMLSRLTGFEEVANIREDVSVMIDICVPFLSPASCV